MSNADPELCRKTRLPQAIRSFLLHPEYRQCELDRCICQNEEGFPFCLEEVGFRIRGRECD